MKSRIRVEENERQQEGVSREASDYLSETHVLQQEAGFRTERFPVSVY